MNSPIAIEADVTPLGWESLPVGTTALIIARCISKLSVDEVRATRPRLLLIVRVRFMAASVITIDEAFRMAHDAVEQVREEVQQIAQDARDRVLERERAKSLPDDPRGPMVGPVLMEIPDRR